MLKNIKANSIVYCDTSLVVDYMIASGREPEAVALAARNPFPESDFDRKQRMYWETLFKYDKRYHSLFSIVRMHGHKLLHPERQLRHNSPHPMATVKEIQTMLFSSEASDTVNS